MEQSRDEQEFGRIVGERLQMYRRRKGLTQEVLATYLEMPRATYANIELGRQRVHLDLICKAAAMLAIPITSLVPDKRKDVQIMLPWDDHHYNTTTSSQLKSFEWLLDAPAGKISAEPGSK